MSPLVNVAFDWALRAFGKEHVYNTSNRSLRVAEEAIELCQACNIPKETMLKLVELVYSRPPGEWSQEIGGVLMTTNLVCASIGYNPDDVFEKEVLRVLAKPVEHFTKRNQEKNKLGLTI